MDEAVKAVRVTFIRASPKLNGSNVLPSEAGEAVPGCSLILLDEEATAFFIRPQ
jgi:hypothetical protein